MSPPLTPPPQLHLAPASDPKNISSLKRLNTLLLPIPYRESFYSDILSNATDSALSRVAFWEGSISIVGGIRARWELTDGTLPKEPIADITTIRGGKIYLMTICVLSPFRGVGVAAALLADVVETAKRWGVEEVYAHVWQENRDALEWYRKRGFVVDEGVVEGYYMRLKPGGARIVRLRIKGVS
ncbi:acyl-CoA N-acyltransferase [Sphaerosporella brunnea]|uniref:Acyl-CoA N-acyltransferase n=1 Tax=Sphaerosporella brunnea TaxID=1250544 RepID=A0A5J5ECK4_9PEZI|nr:acyl-CoA N-acyltransferase [Sphaerosporella brunnea]